MNLCIFVVYVVISFTRIFVTQIITSKILIVSRNVESNYLCHVSGWIDYITVMLQVLVEIGLEFNK